MKNGQFICDTNGNILHAHGGYIIRHDGFYYWYGEDRTDGNYVSCYRSTDLKTWEFRNHILTVNSVCKPYRVRTGLKLRAPHGGKVNIERPKVLFCELTGKFVMWAHYENGKDYNDAACCVATCDTPDGNFVYHGHFNPYGHMSRDCTLFLDDDGTAYFVSAARDNADLHVYRLADDFMNVDKLVNVLWQGEYREAPAIFKKEGKYYMLSSFCTGWAPNQGCWSVSDSMDGKWALLRNFGDKKTYFSQPAFVLPVERDGVTEYLYFGDRWGDPFTQPFDYAKSTYIVLTIQFDETGAPYIIWSDDAPI